LPYGIVAANDPVNKIDPSGEEFDIGSLATSMAIGGVLNSIASYQPGQAFGQVAENFAIGALEGAAFYGVGAVAIKTFMKFGRFIKVARLASSINKYWTKVIGPTGTIAGTSLPEFFVFNTRVGKYFISSGGGGGALKHLVEYISRSGSAGTTKLAETFALQELEEAIILAERQGIVNMETVAVKTAFAEWKLIFQTEVQSGQLPKLFHALFTPL
jgi:hypothetical protein